MSSRKSQSSRRNGAKSHGPVTAQGKAHSSHNALRHGLSSQMIVLPHENPAEFEQLRADYIQDFRPANQSQLHLVESLAATRWRMNRMLAMEARLFEKEMCLRDEDIAEEIKNIDQPGKLAWCFDKMANESKAFALLIRYEGNLNRTYERALKQLILLQDRDRKAADPTPDPANRNTARPLSKVQNEPKVVEISPPERSPLPENLTLIGTTSPHFPEIPVIQAQRPPSAAPSPFCASLLRVA